MAATPNLTIEKTPINELIPYVRNAKEHPDWQVEQIANSIDQFGMNDPIAVWTNSDGGLEIVEGHGRLLACRKLGIDEVPVIKLDHLDDAARKAYILVHNQLTMNTGFDIDTLNAELANLWQFDMADFGFDTPKELEDYEHVEEDEVPITTPPRCEMNDIWQLGEHRLICGDSTKEETVAALMDGKLADLLLTDPPYGVDYEGKTKDKLKIQNDSLKGDAFFQFLVDAFGAAAKHSRAGCAFYIWHPAGAICRTFREAIEETEWEVHQTINWIKNTMVLGHSDYHYRHEPCMYGWKPGSRYFAPTRKETSVIDDSKPVEKMTKEELLNVVKQLTSGAEFDTLNYDKPLRSDLHPTMKPVKLCAHLIRNSSKEGDIVLDIFAGSGSTLIACEQMGRKAYVVEYDPHYCDVIIERWEQLTGKTAEKIN